MKKKTESKDLQLLERIKTTSTSKYFEKDYRGT